MIHEPIISGDFLDLPDDPFTSNEEAAHYWRTQALNKAMTLRKMRALLQQWVDSPIIGLVSRDCFAPPDGLVYETVRVLAEAE